MTAAGNGIPDALSQIRYRGKKRVPDLTNYARLIPNSTRLH